MRNKYLVMAVVTAMLSLVILPTALATTTSDSDISVNITSGAITLTGAGALASSIALTGLDTPPVDATWTNWTGAVRNSDYLRIVDASDAGTGWQLNLASDAVMAYSGTTDQADISLSGGNFLLCPEKSSSGVFGKALSWGTVSSAAYPDTINVVLAGTADAMELESFTDGYNLAFSADDYCVGISSAATQIFASEAVDVSETVIVLGGLAFQVPGGANSGDYTTTLYFTLTE